MHRHDREIIGMVSWFGPADSFSSVMLLSFIGCLLIRQPHLKNYVVQVGETVFVM